MCVVHVFQVLSSSADVLWMSVVRGVRRVGRVYEKCWCLVEARRGGMCGK